MKRLLLIGAGHAHAQVLLEFSRRRPRDLELTLVSPAALAPYSGMVPGWMAGHYDWDACCLDFARLCREAGAVLRLDTATAIDSARGQVELASGAHVSYDVLSLDIGSTSTSHSTAPAALAGALLLPMRPLGALHARWHTLRETVKALAPTSVFRVAMVGGGAAGAECILAAQHQLAAWSPQVCFEYVLATRGTAVLPGLAARAGRLIDERLRRADVRIVFGFDAQDVDGHTVRSRDGRALDADVVLWATGGQAYAWPAGSGLALDEAGFIRVDAMLRSVSHPNIFAAGDCASHDAAVPKAGVFAVRMGPVLSHNLRASLQGRPLRSYRPQRRYLALLSVGKRHAIAAWGPFAWQGGWVWRWKDRIDRGFLRRYAGTPRVPISV